MLSFPRLILLGLVAAYAMSGLYIVKGNEQVLVCRCGKAGAQLVGSGLHFDLPWPFVELKRLNVHEVRTLVVGTVTGSDVLSTGGGFLQEVNQDRQAEFLTGDKNILNLQVNVQYRVEDPRHYLFASRSPELELRFLTEAELTDVVSRSGVDYVHPLGLHELRESLSRRVRQGALERGLGVAVDDVTIVSVAPPVEVKAAFLDVSNARAEKDRLINEELTRAEQLLAQAQSQVQQWTDRAHSEKRTRVEAARGAADRFVRTIQEMRSESQGTGRGSYGEVRARVMQRLYTEWLEGMLPRLAGQVVLDSGKPVDLTIMPKPSAPLKPQPTPAGSTER